MWNDMYKVVKINRDGSETFTAFDTYDEAVAWVRERLSDTAADTFLYYIDHV